MDGKLDVETLKAKSRDFVDLTGNKHDTTSKAITSLLAPSFAVQHGENPPSQGGRDAFLTRLGERLKLARGHVKVDIRQMVAEVFNGGSDGGQCWVYTSKHTPLGSTESLDIITFDRKGLIIFCQDLHSPKYGRISALFPWLMAIVFSLFGR